MLSVEDGPSDGGPSQLTAHRLGRCWLLPCTLSKCVVCISVFTSLVMHAGESCFLNACTYTQCFLSCSPAVVYLLSLNRLCTLPKGFGAFACMEVLDLSYNNLNSESLPGNFFYMGEFYWHKPGFSTNVVLF